MVLRLTFTHQKSPLVEVWSTCVSSSDYTILHLHDRLNDVRYKVPVQLQSSSRYARAQITITSREIKGSHVNCRDRINIKSTDQ